MRLFIAIELPEEVKDVIVRAQARVPAGLAAFAKVKRENLHLTLKFLGEVDERKAAKIQEALRAVPFPRFDAALSGIGVFPSENYIRVVWAGLEGKGIIALQKQADAALAPLGFAPEKEFTPHLTLCRVRSVTDRKAFAAGVAAIAMERKAFSVASFRLMKSTLAREGPLYETVEEFSAA